MRFARFIHCGSAKPVVPYKETHDLTLLDALRPFHPLRVGEAGGALSKHNLPTS